jgi:hypothetical protein
MRDLLSLVNEWDPIGLLALGAPRDEYDCLVGPLLTRLDRGDAAATIETWLSRHIPDHFGVAPHDPGAFAARAIEWHASQTR